MIQDIFDTGKYLFRLSARLCTKQDAERYKLANLLEVIGYVVKDTAIKLNEGEFPCCRHQKLEMLCDELYFRLSTNIGEIKARMIVSKLKNGYQPGQIQSELDQSQSTHHYLTLLEEASGYFLATSDRLRAG